MKCCIYEWFIGLFGWKLCKDCDNLCKHVLCNDCEYYYRLADECDYYGRWCYLDKETRQEMVKRGFISS